LSVAWSLRVRAMALLTRQPSWWLLFALLLAASINNMEPAPRASRMRLIGLAREDTLRQRDDEQGVDETAVHYIGLMNVKCDKCGAWLFGAEQKTPRCCFRDSDRKEVPLPPPLPPYPFMAVLRDPVRSAIFRKNVRRINSVFAFASAVTSVDHSVAAFTYKIHGAHVHLVSSRLDSDRVPNPGDPSQQFMNWFILDTTEENRADRMEEFFVDDASEYQQCREMLSQIDAFLQQNNPLARVLKQVGRLQQQQQRGAAAGQPQPRLVLLGDMDGRTGIDRRYNRPTAEEIAVILPGHAVDNPNNAAFRELQIWWEKGVGNTTLQYLTESLAQGPHRSARVLAFPVGAAHAPPPLPPLQLGAAAPVAANAEGEDERNDEPQTQRVRETHMLWEPLRYPVVLPHASRGWGLDFSKTWTLQKYVRYYCATRNPALLDQLPADWNCFGKLFHEWLVDQFVRIESTKLLYIRTHQDQIRAAQYAEVEQRLAEGVDDFRELGQRVILPASFSGSPRSCLHNYQDAMGAAVILGNPQLFITFTANPEWREITENLRPGETALDRPDLVGRVFHIKLQALLQSLGFKNPDRHRFSAQLGRCRFCVYTIEFQKRGLPHAHILLTYSNPITTEIADQITCAELPNPQTQPQLFAAVSRKLLHECKYGRCLGADGRCIRRFPKAFADVTTIDERGQVTYRRRNNPNVTVVRNITDMHGRRIQAHLGNAFVVPNNPAMTLEFDAHINVEIVNTDPTAPPTPQLFKYVMNYIFKGGDRIVAGVDWEHRQLDEIKQYVDCRYVSSYEAHWRIMEFQMH
jgi:hypothetical protein